MKSMTFEEAVATSAQAARVAEPTNPDARARMFVSTLAVKLQSDHPAVAAEVLTVLINVPTMGGRS